MSFIDIFLNYMGIKIKTKKISNKYIKIFNQIGEGELNQKLVTKDWDDRFSLYSLKCVIK